MASVAGTRPSASHPRAEASARAAWGGYRPAIGGELFADLTVDPLNLHAEAYVAQKLVNMGSLNLSFGRHGHERSAAEDRASSGRSGRGPSVLTRSSRSRDPLEIWPIRGWNGI